MKLITITILVIIFSVSLITGCNGEVYSYDNFVDGLRDSVVSVEIGGELKVFRFLVKGKNIRVNGENVNVFEFDNETQADQEAALVFPDGFGMSRMDETGTTHASAWSPIGPPHFYKKGRLIVHYVDVSHGSDPTVRNLLESILGIQFAGFSTTSLVSIQLPELDEVTDALGYSLAPANMPEGFDFGQSVVSGTGSDTEAVISYVRVQNSTSQGIVILYPFNYPSYLGEGLDTEIPGPNWQRPDDAVTELKINGETAYLVRGMWSNESLQKLMTPDSDFLATYTPKWDYDMYLNLFFKYNLPSGYTVDVMINTAFYPSEWITTDELVDIAKSVQFMN